MTTAATVPMSLLDECIDQMYEHFHNRLENLEKHFASWYKSARHELEELFTSQFRSARLSYRKYKQTALTAIRKVFHGLGIKEAQIDQLMRIVKA